MSEPLLSITATDKAEGFASGSPVITPTARTGIKEPREHSDKAERYAQFLEQVTYYIDASAHEVSVMANVAAALRETFGFFWVGFYIVRGEQLVLGPFQGSMACTSIKYGRGVCGTAWKEARTLVVDDVEQFPGHIACSSLSRSEIVVPIISQGEVKAVLDIDSDRLAAFDDTDRQALEQLAELMSPKAKDSEAKGPEAPSICAIATAQGGAIGIVRLSGTDAISIADSIFRAKGNKQLSQRKTATIAYGHIEDDDGETIDEVMVSIFRAPHSYTGEDSVEIACHGSTYILNKVVELLCAHGCRMANGGEYTQRAFLNGKMDLSQAEAVADLIASRSRASHRLAINQMRGGISRKLAELRDKLLRLTSLLELELDFSEEDVEFADRNELFSIAEDIKREINTLTATFSDGNALKNGVPVAIIGAPNVGKSTLLNALLRDDRAIVSSQSGTTRDLIEDTVSIGGTLFRFIDTAGLRHTTDHIEQMGIERSMQAARKARIILLVTEPGVPYPTIEPDESQTVIKILNKTNDFQAINSKGLPWLEDQLAKAVPQVDSDTLLITNQRHKEALTQAHTDIERAIRSLRTNLSGDLIAEDLRQCITHLAEIVGEISTTAVLENIFQHFCVGK